MPAAGIDDSVQIRATRMHPAAESLSEQIHACSTRMTTAVAGGTRSAHVASVSALLPAFPRPYVQPLTDIRLRGERAALVCAHVPILNNQASLSLAKRSPSAPPICSARRVSFYSRRSRALLRLLSAADTGGRKVRKLSYIGSLPDSMRARA